MLIINKALDVIPFEADHIRKSIYSAAKAVYGQDVDKKIDCQVIAATVTKKLEALGVEKIGIETVQDIVELSLMENHQYAVAKAFIIYREKRATERAAKNDVISYVEVMNGYLDKSDWRTKENSNVNYSIGGSILHNNSSITANYWLKRIYSPRVADAHKNADMHIHDLGMFEPYCFERDTRFVLADGSTKSFAECEADGITKLDVLSYDESTGKSCRLPAVDIGKRSVDDLYEVSLSDGSKIRCTSYHRLMTNRGLVAVKDITEDDILVTV